MIDVAQKMLTAARTAPKAKGLDIIEAAVVTGEDIDAISATMSRLFEETGRPVYKRDSENILSANAILLIGTKSSPLGLDCGHCGFPACAEKPEAIPCAINCCDVGIALGSAVSVAADNRVDTRIMFSVGVAAEKMRILGDDVRQVYAVSISASSKNPFFDR